MLWWLRESNANHTTFLLMFPKQCLHCRGSGGLSYRLGGVFAGSAGGSAPAIIHRNLWYLVTCTFTPLMRNGRFFNFQQKHTMVFIKFPSKTPLALLVPPGCLLGVSWVLLGASQVPTGCLLDASWVPPEDASSQTIRPRCLLYLLPGASSQVPPLRCLLPRCFIPITELCSSLLRAWICTGSH